MKAKPIVLQHDNASPHAGVYTGEQLLTAKCVDLGLSIVVRPQARSDKSLRGRKIVYQQLQTQQLTTVRTPIRVFQR